MNKIMSQDLEKITKKNIKNCIDWYKEYGIQYNPHLDKEEFVYFIHYIINKCGVNNINLNFIDTAEVTSMKCLFYKSEFNGDISEWDVSSVIDMCGMFMNSEFNRDISNWDVSNVRDMSGMFMNSKFNKDISNWKVSKVENMWCLFSKSEFDGDISDWDISNVINMTELFFNSKFNKDISNWNINSNCKTTDMCKGCPIKDKYKPKGIL